MTRGESSQAFHASALANAIVAFNEIVLIAAPGTGKTTTLLQVSEAILSRGNSIAVFIPLSEWSSQSDSLLASIARRHAFLESGEDQLAQQARQGRLVLLLDGWNELDSASRHRARSENPEASKGFPRFGHCY
jgi:primosomal protein N'